MKLKRKQVLIWNEEYKRGSTNWNKETLNLPKILKSRKVLELGVGNGKTLRVILSQRPKEVFALDFSNEAIIKCKKHFEGKEITFIIGDITKMPFKNEEFEFIVCRYTLNNLLERERKIAINEIYRVLEKKGKVIFEDFSKGDFRQKSSKNTIENETILKNNGLICHFFDIKEIKELFNKFSRVELKKRTSTPIKNRPELKRKIISGIIKK